MKALASTTAASVVLNPSFHRRCHSSHCLRPCGPVVSPCPTGRLQPLCTLASLNTARWAQAPPSVTLRHNSPTVQPLSNSQSLVFLSNPKRLSSSPPCGGADGACRGRELKSPHLDFGNAPLRILQYILLMTDDIFCLALI
ncbi:hypothetical protein HN873_060725 [Arachis hypogaea]